MITNIATLISDATYASKYQLYERDNREGIGWLIGLYVAR